MTKKNYLLLSILLIVPLLLGAKATTVEDVSKHLVCQCGCANMIVSSCQCGMAHKFKDEIGKKLKAGETKEQILASFIERYGEKVIAEPSKKGFNLSAWITPFVLLLLGLIAGVYVIRIWIRSAHKRRDTVSPAEEVVDNSTMAQMDKELSEMDEY